MSETVTGFHEQTAMAWPPGVQPEDCVVIFDGVCKFCNRSVQFLLRHERHPVLRFAAAQSTTGSALLAHFGLLIDGLNTVVLIERGKAYGKSDAALHFVTYLRWPWQWLRLGWVLPRRFRNWLYDGLAARRYAWFGKSETCMVPTPEVTRRFLP
jgi:predicted DCC family thiol-disulfide oxidoreductase YuxK